MKSWSPAVRPLIPPHTCLCSCFIYVFSIITNSSFLLKSWNHPVRSRQESTHYSCLVLTFSLSIVCVCVETLLFILRHLWKYQENWHHSKVLNIAGYFTKTESMMSSGMSALISLDWEMTGLSHTWKHINTHRCTNLG